MSWAEELYSSDSLGEYPRDMCPDCHKKAKKDEAEDDEIQLCQRCGVKYEMFWAEEYYSSDSDGEYPRDMCPDCDKKAKKDEAKDDEIQQLRARVKELEDALKRATKEAPPAKKQKTESVLPKTVWLVTKADLPEDQQQHDRLATCAVIGTYLSKAKAEEAMEAFLEEGGWEEGYGYHQGTCFESNIKVMASRLTA